ncbi:hypothetical protein [Nostoc sp.]|uniref:hypothetical protein n=1 Tax=Nostoc sp. TaxID=1180 RepID=UPI002FF4914F
MIQRLHLPRGGSHRYTINLSILSTSGSAPADKSWFAASLSALMPLGLDLIAPQRGNIAAMS